MTPCNSFQAKYGFVESGLSRKTQQVCAKPDSPPKEAAAITMLSRRRNVNGAALVKAMPVVISLIARSKHLTCGNRIGSSIK